MCEFVAVFDAVDHGAEVGHAVFEGGAFVGEEGFGFGGELEAAGHGIWAEGFLFEEECEDCADEPWRSCFETVHGEAEELGDVLEDLAGGPVAGVCEFAGIVGGLEGVEFAFEAVDAVEGEFSVGGGFGIDGHL